MSWIYPVDKKVNSIIAKMLIQVNFKKSLIFWMKSIEWNSSDPYSCKYVPSLYEIKVVGIDQIKV